MKLTVASPCSESWDTMSGDEKMRFCGRCKLNVFNLSAMSEEEADRLLKRPEGLPCVRFYQRRDGTILTQDCPVGWRRKIAKRVAIAATFLFGIIFAVGSFESEGTSAKRPAWVQAAMDWLNPPSPPVVKPLPSWQGQVMGRIRPRNLRPPGP